MQRDHDADRGAAPARALDLTAAAQGLRAFLHAAQAEARRRHGIDSTPVVADRERKLRRAIRARVHLAHGFTQLDGYMPSVRMPNDVSQALLHAAINREVDRVAVAAHEVVGADGEVNL